MEGGNEEEKEGRIKCEMMDKVEEGRKGGREDLLTAVSLYDAVDALPLPSSSPSST